MNELVGLGGIIAREDKETGLVAPRLRHEQVMGDLGAGDEAVRRKLPRMGGAGFIGIAVADSDFLVVTGRTSLKARSCFAAASELFNVCLERDSRSRAAWLMGKR